MLFPFEMYFFEVFYYVVAAEIMFIIVDIL